MLTSSGLSTHVARKKQPATPLGARLRWITDTRDISARALSLAAGKSGTYVAQIIRGDIGERISYESFVALARAGRVNVHWLQTGEGSADALDAEPVYDADLGDLVDQVASELNLDASVERDLRAHAWTGGLPSYGTLRSYAVDLMGQRSGKAKMPPPDVTGRGELMPLPSTRKGK